jgi:DNA polymerase I-like protein with 3'-5' exonuclease and polymerase domains
MLANYINDIVFTREVVDGDIHTKNQNDAGLPTRDDAKTFIYAFIYGAGNLKIGRIIGGAEQDGAAIKRKFLKQNPKLASLIKSVQKAAGRGYLVGLDGRKIRLRRDKETGEIQTHKALNTLLQSGGALVMKWSMIFLDQLLREAGLHSKKVIDMHDEGQSEVPTEEATIHAELAVESIRIAGRYLDLNCPLDGEAKIGLNWAQTH